MRSVAIPFLTLSFALSMWSADADPLYEGGIVAVVNDNVITRFEAMQQVKRVENSLGAQAIAEQPGRDEILQMVTQELVNQELIWAEFQTLEGTVPREPLQRRLNEQIERHAGGSRARYLEMLKERGMTLSEVREEIKKSLAVELMLERFVRQPIQVTPAEIQTYYREHGEEFAEPEQLRLQMILLQADASSSKSLDIRVKEVMKKLEQGESFTALAREYSDDAHSASRGGDLGLQRLCDISASFCKVAETLESGAVAKPLRQGDNVYILRLAERRAGGKPPLDDDLRQRIRRILWQREEQRRRAEFMERLQQKHFVKVFLSE